MAVLAATHVVAGPAPELAARAPAKAAQNPALPSQLSAGLRCCCPCRFQGCLCRRCHGCRCWYRFQCWLPQSRAVSVSAASPAASPSWHGSCAGRLQRRSARAGDHTACIYGEFYGRYGKGEWVELRRQAAGQGEGERKWYVRWSVMRWDGMGWDRMGCDGVASQLRRSIRSVCRLSAPSPDAGRPNSRWLLMMVYRWRGWCPHCRDGPRMAAAN